MNESILMVVLPILLLDFILFIMIKTKKIG